MNQTFDMQDFVAAAGGDKEHMLGKFLYFSLANLLVEKNALSQLCKDMDIPYSGGERLSVSDAFRGATGDIRERIPVTANGQTNIYLAYCRDNKRTASVLSRELVKETLNQQTNHYEKLANISYDKADDAKRHYEQVLCQELDGLDDEFSTLKFMAQELQTRANNIRLQKKPRREKIDQTEIGLFQAA